MPNTKQWTDPDGQINNTGPNTTGVYLVDPATRLAYAAGGGGGGGAVTIADGADVALGTTTDAAGANTVVGQLKAINVDTADIETNTSNIPPLGQAVMAGSTPVVIASNQSNVPISGTVTTTPPANASTNVTQIGGAAISEGQNTMANSIPVAIASNQSNVPISGTVTTTPPANASTNLTQVGGAAIAEGQTTMANSLPMAIASDQSDLPIRRDRLEVTASSGANAVLFTQDVSNYNFISVHVNQIATNATLTFQASNDNFATQIENVNLARISSSSSIVATATTTGMWSGPSNFRYFRINQSGATASTTNVTVEFFTNPSTNMQINAVQGGTWTVTANAGTNLNTSALALEAGHLATIDSHIPAQGQAVMASSVPVVIASNQSNVPVNVATALPAGSNIIGLVEQSDGTNVSNVLKSDMTAAGQNAELVAPTYFSTGTLTLNAGSPNTIWYDLGNYPWISLEILTNASAATLTFQTSGDASETNVRTSPLLDSQNVNGGLSTTATSAVSSFYGPRTGRYFRISSNVAGGNTVTMVLTFYTSVSQLATMQIAVNGSGATGSAVPSQALFQGVSDGTNLQGVRTPAIFQTAVATASGDNAVWTPAAGKKFRLMAYSIEMTANASQAASGTFETILRDGTSPINMGMSSFVPMVAATAFGNNVSTGWRILGNGKLSSTANNVLNVNLSAALATGEVRVNAIGTEE